MIEPASSSGILGITYQVYLDIPDPKSQPSIYYQQDVIDWQDQSYLYFRLLPHIRIQPCLSVCIGPVVVVTDGCTCAVYDPVVEEDGVWDLA